ISCRYGNNAGQVIAGDRASLDTRGNKTRCGGAVAETSVPVDSPSPNISFRIDDGVDPCADGDSMLAAAGRRDHSIRHRNLDRFGEVAAAASVAARAVLIRTPDP